MKAETLLAKVQKAQQLCEGCHWCREEARLNNEPCCFREYHSNGLDRGTPNCVFAKGITREKNRWRFPSYKRSIRFNPYGIASN